MNRIEHIGDATLYLGDCRDVMASWPECFRAGAIVTDPPYGLGEKWQGPYLKPGTTLDDPWGHKIRYELIAGGGDGAEAGNASALPYKLFSVGPDGQPDTEDDIKHGAEPAGSENTGR